MKRIAYENDPLTPLRLDYTYTDRDEIETITEYVGGDPAETHLTTFTYDKRGRLTHECRTLAPSGPAVYDLGYAYDAGGNRLAKTDSVNARRVDYHYDLYDQEHATEPHVYDSDNPGAPGLMSYETFDTTGRPRVFHPCGT